MEMTADRSPAGSINYAEPPITQARIDEADYRIDPGFGSAVAISTRAEGTWTWAVLAEGRWDGLRLKVKALDRPVVAVLERALSEAMKERNEA